MAVYLIIYHFPDSPA